ncbi:hypothetical protein D3C73_640740 [compost metagenome]
MKFPDQEDWNRSYAYNIDIEFSAVVYVDLPTILNGIVIIELLDNIPEKFQDFKLKFGHKIFEIKSSGNSYYIVAGNYRIGKNTWLNKDRIIDMNLEHDSIIGVS